MNRILLFGGVIIGLFCVNNKAAKAQTIETRCATVVDSILHKVVYLNTDKIPEPIEKYSTFQSTIFKQIKSSQDYEEYTGRVVVAFVVESNGEIVGIRAVHDKTNTHHFFSDQIVQAIKNYKHKWKPASCNGNLVPALVYLPFIIHPQE